MTNDVCKALRKLHKSMMGRCYCKTQGNYKYYGGRGIKVAKRWHDFRNFYKDMKDSYTFGFDFDRIDTNKNYSKKNCQFVSHADNMRNRRCSLFCEIKTGVFMPIGRVVDLENIDAKKAKRKYKTIRKEYLFHETKRYFEHVYNGAKI